MSHVWDTINEYAGWLEILNLTGDVQLFPRGRVVRAQDVNTDAAHSLILPFTESLWPGGPYFYVVNADASNGFAVSYRDDAQLLTAPEDFTDAAWIKDGNDPPTVTPNTTVAPDGTTTADTVNFGPTTGTVSSRLRQLVSYDETKPHQLTYFVKNLESFAVELNVTHGAESLIVHVEPDGEWHRIGGQPPLNTATEQVRLQKVSSHAGFSVALWGAMLTEGNVLRDYVPASYTDPVADLNALRATQIWLAGSPFAGVAKKWVAAPEVVFSEGGTINPTVITP